MQAKRKSLRCRLREPRGAAEKRLYRSNRVNYELFSVRSVSGLFGQGSGAPGFGFKPGDLSPLHQRACCERQHFATRSASPLDFPTGPGGSDPPINRAGPLLCLQASPTRGESPASLNPASQQLQPPGRIFPHARECRKPKAEPAMPEELPKNRRSTP
jgi:hypothetical protein